MKRLLVLLIVLGTSVGCELRPPSGVKAVPDKSPVVPESPAAGTPSEAVPVYLQGGQGGFTMANLKGRVVLLDICAPWSPASRALIP